MGKFSSNLINGLTEFLICELGGKALQGITYTMVLKDKAGLKEFERYKLIKEESLKCGYSNDEVFRIYELRNGYILDMDVNIARKISIELIKALEKTDKSSIDMDIALGSMQKRKSSDMARLAKQIKNSHEQGEKEIEVALFSRNTVPRIVINGVGPNNEPMPTKYNAYSIRHWDLTELNQNILIPEGLRVSKIEPIEILPSKTGVRFILTIESI